MATLALSVAGAGLGAVTGGSLLGFSSVAIGRFAGALAGSVIDQKVLGGGSRALSSPRLDRIKVNSSSYGIPLGSCYGRVRKAGNLIWSSPIKENSSINSSGGKGVPSTSVTTYSYTISCAIALAEGEIAGVARIWADGIEIAKDDLNYTIYHGTQNQFPDSTISSFEGTNRTPAFRGTAYIVFENLSLNRFGNRVPQFNFEVIGKLEPSLDAEKGLQDILKGVALIPGSGEYSLATSPVRFDRGLGTSTLANSLSVEKSTDAVVSLDDLQRNFPNCKSVVLVVSWFGDDLRCSECQVIPKCDQDLIDSSEMPWTVSGVSRIDSSLVASQNGRPVYGGTPSDASVIQIIKELRSRNISVVFYPFILMDQLQGNELIDPWTGDVGQAHLPWRGRITSSLAPNVIGSVDATVNASDEVRRFFGAATLTDFHAVGDNIQYSEPSDFSYRRFILHYAKLCELAGGVEAFCIGSEMRSLTQIRGAQNSFPAVEELVRLADDVKAVLGSECDVGYAADWSEYFGYTPQDGSGSHFFHLDPLWASQYIDFIGIDNYKPLADWRDGFEHEDAAWKSPHNIDYLKSNIEGGEGFDWYYEDEDARIAQDRLLISDGDYDEPWIWRYKDLKSWWSFPHHNRINGVRQSMSTDWVPESKPIWFTEFGCAAVDKAANQPNKFLDAKSSESSLPYFSNGSRDDLIQMNYLRAVQNYWEEEDNNPVSNLYDGRMLNTDKFHAWAWDARPYPYFPALSDVWSDSENYYKGHWLNGRASSVDLAHVVKDICKKWGIENVDTTKLFGFVRGFSIDELTSGRAILQQLMIAYGFDVYEKEGVLHFVSRSGEKAATITADDIAEHPDQEESIAKTRTSSAEELSQISLLHVSADSDYSVKTASAGYSILGDRSVAQSELNLALTAGEASRIAERWLNEVRVGRNSVSFALPLSFANLSVGDVIELQEESGSALYRIERMEEFDLLLIEAVQIDPRNYVPSGGFDEGDPLYVEPPAALAFPVFLDLPVLTGTENPYGLLVGAVAEPWPGELAVFSSSTVDGFEYKTSIPNSGMIGVTESALSRADSTIFDRGSALQVKFASGTLLSVTEEKILNGANLAAIGNPETDEWEIFQFEKSELIAQGTYLLSKRLRGRFGTEATMPDVWPVGSLIVLLDSNIVRLDLTANEKGLERNYRIGPASDLFGDITYVSLRETGNAIGLRPYSPVHLRTIQDSSGSVDLTWVRRTRIGGDDWSLYDVPLAESSERYLVRVYKDGSEVRNAVTEQASFQYTVEQMTSDGVGANFELSVAQISDLFGPGLETRISVNV